MTHFPLVVVGAGPAGLGAAAEAARCGIRTLVIDERPKPGGAIAGPLPADFDTSAPWLLPPVLHPEQLPNLEHLIQLCRQQNVEFSLDSLVWAIYRKQSWLLAVRRANYTVTFTADMLIIAAGTYVTPEPPYGIHDSQVLTPPSFYQLVNSGAWSDSSATICGNSYLARRLYAWAVDAGLDVNLVAGTMAGGPGQETRSHVVVTEPLSAAVELLLMAGCAVDFAGFPAGFTPRLNENFETSVPGVYAAGGSAGILDPVAAIISGRLAALDAVAKLTHLSYEIEERRRELAGQMALIAGPRVDRQPNSSPVRLANMSSDFIVCPCLGLTLAELQEALALGPATLNDLKRASGLGMGECQGRCCAPAALQLLPSGSPPIKVRPPVRPIRLAQFLAAPQLGGVR